MRKVFLNEKYKLATLKGRMEIEEADCIKEHRVRRTGSETGILCSIGRESRVSTVYVTLLGNGKLLSISSMLKIIFWKHNLYREAG